ncbi:helix-turn-helix domain-containing protein [Marinobacterium stanieri]|uniref:Pyocin large subunit n=1 Tax=Marinobacterium stanieri TaxID=49186 RepID=A0A1N6QCC3_9GAMM|nr:helix-turn-helix domain-containing protein [Marinobacterium stanieri]SIQ14234.1 Pyocin large subunit [Marinobacterium stanieri]
MSRAATDWAWDVNPGKAPLKLILLSMADRADEEHCCFPSIDRLVKDTSLNKKTVQAGINHLVELGLIRDTGERKGPTRRVRVFRLMLDTKPPQKPNHPKKGNITKEAGGPANAPENGNVPENGNIPKSGTLNAPENGFLNVPENGLQNRSLEPVTEPVVDAGASSSSAPVADHPPVDPDEQAHQDAIFSHVDSGPVVPATTNPDRFPMHWQWVPSELFSERCRTAGVNLSSLEPAQQESILGEFRSYWEASGREFNQAQWEHKLLRQLQRVPSSAAVAANQSRQQKRADLSASVMDIEDTSWGD